MHHDDHQIQALHDLYVEAVNIAVGDDNFDLVDRLVAEYDREAGRLGLQRAA